MIVVSELVFPSTKVHYTLPLQLKHRQNPHIISSIFLFLLQDEVSHEEFIVGAAVLRNQEQNLIFQIEIILSRLAITLILLYC